MGVFSKLKGIFYDTVEVEEEEETVKKEEPKRIFKDEKPRVEEIKSVKIEDEVEEEKTVDTFEEEERRFRSERPFNFTELDDVEEALPPRKSVLDIDRERREVKTERYEKPEIPSRILEEINKPKVQEPVKTFKPSLVISPIYGILDKDYKREEIVEKKQPLNESTSAAKTTQYDFVRRKAYGTLEDELEDTLNSMNKVSKEEIEKEVDKYDRKLFDDDNAFEEANKTLAELNEKTQKIEDLINQIEETTDEIDRTMSIGEIEDTNEVVAPEESYIDDKTMTDSTLEHDLFNLIDSMYDDKEE